jgi:Peptidase propeptide and YPEB domain
MRTIVAAAAFALLASTTAYAAKEALTEQQIEGVQMAIKAMGFTVEDNNIEAEGAGYEADDVICKDDGQYDVYLDKDFKVTKKVKED